MHGKVDMFMELIGVKMTEQEIRDDERQNILDQIKQLRDKTSLNFIQFPFLEWTIKNER